MFASAHSVAVIASLPSRRPFPCCPFPFIVRTPHWPFRWKHRRSQKEAIMLKTQSGKRQREKLKNARATARSMHTTAEGHVREVVEEPAHDFRFKGAVG